MEVLRHINACWWWFDQSYALEVILRRERDGASGLTVLVGVGVAVGGAASGVVCGKKTVDCDASPRSKNANLVDPIECGWTGGKVQQHACARVHVKHAEL